jgi:hypothetical protein
MTSFAAVVRSTATAGNQQIDCAPKRRRTSPRTVCSQLTSCRRERMVTTKSPATDTALLPDRQRPD